MNHLKLTLVSLAALIILPVIFGCSAYVKPQYGPKLADSKKSGGSQKHFMVMSDFDRQDTVHAVKKALGMNGVMMEKVSNDMISGFHHYEPDPGTNCLCTFAFYFKPSINNSTEVVMLVDDHTWISSRGDTEFASKIIATINTVLASYE